MDQGRGDTAIVMGETRARDYYKRAGFDGLFVRSIPSVRNRQYFVQIRETELIAGEIVEIVVYPELILRSKPWRMWGKMVDLSPTVVTMERVVDGNKGEVAGTLVRIPFRYFQDGRVYLVGMLDDESE